MFLKSQPMLTVDSCSLQASGADGEIILDPRPR